MLWITNPCTGWVNNILLPPPSTCLMCGWAVTFLKLRNIIQFYEIFSGHINAKCIICFKRNVFAEYSLAQKYFYYYRLPVNLMPSPLAAA